MKFNKQELDILNEALEELAIKYEWKTIEGKLTLDDKVDDIVNLMNKINLISFV